MIYLTIILMALNYALKGGQGRTIFKGWARLRAKNAFTERLFDGKIISTILVFLFIAVATSKQIGVSDGAYLYRVYSLTALSFAIGWIVSIAPSIRNETDAIWGQGEYIKWMPKLIDIKVPKFLANNTSHTGDHYLTYIEGRAYGIKKAVQRGMFIGGIMTIATSFVPFLYFSLFYVPILWSLSVVMKLFKVNSPHTRAWVASEYVIGAILYGIPTGMWIAQLK